MKLQKNKKVKDDAYKYWLASHYDCALCGSPSSSPHHLPNPEHGPRRNRDDMQLPICFKCHQYLHAHPSVEMSHLSEFYDVANKCWEDYCAKN